MAQPHPPQGEQKQYTERPLKIFGEQYVVDGQFPVGAVVNPGDPPIYTDGLPRVVVGDAWVVVHLTDWVITHRYTGVAMDVISAEEFSERFGPGGGAPLPTEGP
jgi:hypothetical protein